MPVSRQSAGKTIVNAAAKWKVSISDSTVVVTLSYSHRAQFKNQD